MIFLVAYVAPVVFCLVFNVIVSWKDIHTVGDILFPNNKICWWYMVYMPIANYTMIFMDILVLIGILCDIKIKK